MTLLVFAATAIALAVISVYGVLWQRVRVRERSREIGIRMAIGADAFSLVGRVAGLRFIAIGMAAGLLTPRPWPARSTESSRCG